MIADKIKNARTISIVFFQLESKQKPYYIIKGVI